MSGMQSEDSGTDVLLVGATTRDARVVSCGLAREGISMGVAADVRTAIDRLATTDDDRSGAALPGLVVIDLAAEREDGLTVLNAVTESPRLRALPTVAIIDGTVPTDEHRRRVQSAYEDGVNGCVSKPHDVEAYADTIQRMAAVWFGRASLPPESLYFDSASVQYD